MKTLKVKAFSLAVALFVVYSISTIYILIRVNTILAVGSRSGINWDLGIEFILIAGGCLNFAWLLYQRVFRQLDTLNEGANVLAGGDLTEKITVQGQDEIAQLAANFNHMTDRLREMIYTLKSNTSQLSESTTTFMAGVQENSKALEQVAVVVQNSSEGAMQQNQAVEAAQSTLIEFEQRANEILMNSEQMSSLAQTTGQVVDTGADSAASSMAQMKTIQDSVQELGEMIDTLSSRSTQIEGIVESITGIAGQTNLLALNAAIEAARAGESGKGFAVVAEEVRKLAEQSADSAAQISDIVEGIRTEIEQAATIMNTSTGEVEQGINAVQKVESAFEESKEAFDTVAKQVEKVLQGMNSISSGVKTLGDGMDRIASIAASTEQSMETASAATEEQLASTQENTSFGETLVKLNEEVTQVIKKVKVE